MNPVDERFEHRLLDRFHYDDRQDGDGYGPDSPRVGDKGWIIWQTAFNELDRPFEIVRDEGRGRTGLPLLLVGMEDNYGDDWHIRENDDSQYMSLLEAGLDGASLTLMERKHGIARWRAVAWRRTGRNHHGRAAPHRIPVGGIMSIETSIIYTTSDGKQFDDRQEAETHEQWLADEPEAREADRQRGWTDYTPPQPEWKPEPKPATPDITDHDGPRSVSEADWLEFNTEANDYGVPDRAGLQSVIDVIGEHYLHLAREWGWNDTEVRDAMYVETKQRGWCRE